MFDVYEYFSTTFHRDFFFFFIIVLILIQFPILRNKIEEVFKFKNYITDKEGYNANDEQMYKYKIEIFI